MAAVLIIGLAAACGQTSGNHEGNNPDHRVLRSPSVQLAERRSSTPPLSLIASPNAVPNASAQVVHKVKPVPRDHVRRTAATPDPVLQSSSVSSLAPTLSLNFAGLGE